jgi:hypothetical protein
MAKRRQAAEIPTTQISSEEQADIQAEIRAAQIVQCAELMGAGTETGSDENGAAPKAVQVEQVDAEMQDASWKDRVGPEFQTPVKSAKRICRLESRPSGEAMIKDGASPSRQ